MHLSIVGGHKSHLELGVLQQLKWLYQRDGKFTYCRPVFNPLITVNAFWRLTLGLCYQLVQSVVKVSFVLAKKVG